MRDLAVTAAFTEKLHQRSSLQTVRETEVLQGDIVLLAAEDLPELLPEHVLQQDSSSWSDPGGGPARWSCVFPL